MSGSAPQVGGKGGVEAGEEEPREGERGSMRGCGEIVGVGRSLAGALTATGKGERRGGAWSSFESPVRVLLAGHRAVSRALHPAPPPPPGSPSSFPPPSRLPTVVTDPTFLVTRSLEDFLTWVDSSKIKRAVVAYNDKLDDFDLLGN